MLAPEILNVPWIGRWLIVLVLSNGRSNFSSILADPPEPN